MRCLVISIPHPFFLPLLIYKAGFPPWLSSKIIYLQMQETWGWSLCWEDPWRRKWQSTSVFLSGKFYGWRSLKGYSPKGCQESDGLSTHTSIKHIHILGFCILYYYLYISLLVPGFRSLPAWVHVLRALFREGLLHSKFSKILCIRKYPPFFITFRWQSSWIQLWVQNYFFARFRRCHFSFPLCLVLFRTLTPVWSLFFPTWKLLEFFSLALIS